MNFINKFLKLLSKKQKFDAFVLLFLLLIGMLLEMISVSLILPLISSIADYSNVNKNQYLGFIIRAFSTKTQTEFVILMMLLLILIYFIKVVFLSYLTFRQSKYTHDLSKNLSDRLYEGYLKMPYSFHLQNNSAHLLRNISSEISIFTNLTQNLMLLQVNSAIVIGLASILVVIEPKGTALIFFLLGSVGFIFLKIVKKRLQFWGEKRQYHDGYRQQQMMQGFSTIKDIKLLGKELYFATLFKKHNDSLFSTSSKVIVTQQLPRLFFEFFAIVGLAFYIIVISTSGKTMVSALPILGFFVASAFRLIPSLSTIIGSLQVIKYSKSSIILLSEEFDKINKNKLLPNKNKFVFENEIQFINLSFNYFGTNNAIISNLNFSVKKGQTIGIIGESGSGKSTLIDLLLGLLNPSSGSILVDSIDINSNILGWQKLIGYVPQSINLLDDTIENNIALGVEKQNIEKSKLTNAIVDAQIENFISSLPEGLNTKVGERGVRLSGGQKQRIGIARSLYNNPSILVLDEATSALDNNTENEVMKSITSLKGKKTIFIIAHRLSTIQNCDVVFNLKNGVLKENN